MFGINCSTIIGEVVREPYTGCDKNARKILVFPIQAQCKDRRVIVWLYSIRDVDIRISSAFDVRDGDYVVAHGELFVPPKDLKQRVGDPQGYTIAVNGRVLAQIRGGELRGRKDRWHHTPTIATGMVLPGARMEKSEKKGEWFIAFTIHCHQKIPISYRRVMESQFRIPCTGLVNFDAPKIIRPGTVVFVRGDLAQSKSKFPFLGCTQVESLGVVQPKLVLRYKEQETPVTLWLLNKQQEVDDGICPGPEDYVRNPQFFEQTRGLTNPNRAEGK